MKKILSIIITIIFAVTIYSCGSAGSAISGAVSVSADVDVSLLMDASGVVKGSAESFSSIAKFSGGIEMTATSSEEVPQRIMEIIDQAMSKDKPFDLAFVVDTTGSMGNHITQVKNTLSKIIEKLNSKAKEWLAAFVEYRDLNEEFVSRVPTPLTKDTKKLQAGIDSLQAVGGGDFCEHVYSGLQTALTDLNWRKGTDHHIILIGDAPAHNYTKEAANADSVKKLAQEKNAHIHTIVISCNTACQVLLKATGSDKCD